MPIGKKRISFKTCFSGSEMKHKALLAFDFILFTNSLLSYFLKIFAQLRLSRFFQSPLW